VEHHRLPGGKAAETKASERLSQFLFLAVEF